LTLRIQDAILATVKRESPPRNRKPTAPIHPKTQSLYRHIGRAVKHAREALEMTQEELASQVGVARTSITNLEKGKQHFPLHHLLSVAELLHMDLVSFIPSSDELESAAVPLLVRGNVLVQGAPRTNRVVAELLR